MLFPAFVSGASLVMMWAFAQGIHVSLPPSREAPRWLTQIGAFMNFRHNPEPLTIVGYYFASLFVATFVNVAFYYELIQIYAGKPLSLVRGMRFAASRFGSILAWSIFAASVGVLIQIVSQRLSWLGRLTGLFGGIAWNIASVFTIPILVREGGYNPLQILRRSTVTVRRTWGDLVYGFFNLGFLPMLLCGFIFALSLSINRGSSVPLFRDGTPVLGFAILVAVSTAVVALQSVFRCALYIYATEGVVPEPFTLSDMDSVWKVKSV